jgi:hypothetical protein
MQETPSSSALLPSKEERRKRLCAGCARLVPRNEWGSGDVCLRCASRPVVTVEDYLDKQAQAHYGKPCRSCS